MIRVRDAAVLATTKLRTRPIRTWVTVVISGLLFASLISALLVAQGAKNSVASFNKEGLNNRYIVQATADPPLSSGVLDNSVLLQRAQQIYSQTVAAKKAAAKQLGITYDASTEPTATITTPAFPGVPSRPILNFNSPSAQQAIAEYSAAHPGPGLAQLTQVAAPYHPNGFYEMTMGGNSNGTFSTMQHGIEDFDPTTRQVTNTHPTDIFQMGSIVKVAPQLTAPFLVHGPSTSVDTNAIPLVLSYSMAAQLLGLAKLPSDATPAAQLNRVKTLYTKASSIAVTACYRNTVSEEQISTAVSQAADIAKNASNKSYQKPELIYGLPDAASCGAAPILSDTRTKDEKSLAAKQDEFSQMFGGIVNPVQQKLTFRVVGLTPDTQNGGSSTTIGGLLQNIVGSSLQGIIAIPSNMLSALPNATSITNLLFPSQTDSLGFPATSYYVEFPHAADARSFIDQKSCTTRSDGTCATSTKPFQLNAYGSNSIALEDLQRKFTHFFEIAVLIVVVIAIVIMTGTIGRMIADGRRETAVFRAIGAKRMDIARVYAIYTLCLSVYVAIFALAAGVIAAYAFDWHFWQKTTIQAQLLFGASNTSRNFHFFGVNLLLIGLVLGIAIASGIVSMILPLLRNVRRSPIKDMREE